MDTGIKSTTEIQIITPDAKAQDAAIKLFLFLILTNIGSVPISVDKPANKVKRKGYTLSPSK